jgi:hypothetical protein
MLEARYSCAEFENHTQKLVRILDHAISYFHQLTTAFLFHRIPSGCNIGWNWDLFRSVHGFFYKQWEFNYTLSRNGLLIVQTMEKLAEISGTYLDLSVEQEPFEEQLRNLNAAEQTNIQDSQPCEFLRNLDEGNDDVEDVYNASEVVDDSDEMDCSDTTTDMVTAFQRSGGLFGSPAPSLGFSTNSSFSAALSRTGVFESSTRSSATVSTFSTSTSGSSTEFGPSASTFNGGLSNRSAGGNFIWTPSAPDSNIMSGQADNVATPNTNTKLKLTTPPIQPLTFLVGALPSTKQPSTQASTNVPPAPRHQGLGFLPSRPQPSELTNTTNLNTPQHQGIDIVLSRKLSIAASNPYLATANDAENDNLSDISGGVTQLS